MLRKIAEYVKKIFRMEPIPTTISTLREALQALEVARNHFENCDPEFVDGCQPIPRRGHPSHDEWQG